MSASRSKNEIAPIHSWQHVPWILLFVLIFLLSLAMRAPEILSRNYLFGFDQGRDYLAAYNIAVSHKITLIGAEVGAGSAGISGLFHGPGYFYLLAIMYIFFRGDPYGGLVLMFLFGVATLITVFVTTRKMFNERVALIALFLVGVAPQIAPQSRFVWNHHPASFFIALYYYFLYKITARPRLYAPLAVLAAGLIYHFEIAMAVPLVILTFVAVPLIHKIADRRIYLYMIVVLLLVLSPMMLFEVRHGFMAVRGIVTHVMTPKFSGASSTQAGSSGDFNLIEKKDAFISNFRDSFVFDYGYIRADWIGFILLAVAAVILFALFNTKDKAIKCFFAAVFLGIPVTILVFLPLRGSVWPYYLIHLQFGYIYAFAFAADVLVSRVRKSPVYIVTTLFIVFFFISMLRGTYFRLRLNWLVDYPDYGATAKIVGKRAAIDYIYADAKGKPFSVFVFTPPFYTWPYDYLFLTYAKEKYGYMPGHEKKGLAYMLIEVDPVKPWSYQGWLETVIKTGTPVWTREVMPSGFLVQKRIF